MAGWPPVVDWADARAREVVEWFGRERRMELTDRITAAIRNAVDEERERWVTHLEAALRDEPDTARSDLNHHWRARVRACVAARIAEERAAGIAVVEAMIEKGEYPVEGGVCCEEILRRLRARSSP